MARNDMRALVKAAPEEGLWMQHVPVPEPGPQDVLVKVSLCGICGSDLGYIGMGGLGMAEPMPLGHELVGTVAETGMDRPMHSKLFRYETDLSEEGVARVFKTRRGADWIVGVMGALQFEVMGDRIRTEYDVPVRFSGGYRADLAPWLMVQVSRGFDVSLWTRWPLAGR